MIVKDLEPIYTRKVTDFYGVNKIITSANGNITLTDCNRPIMRVRDGKPKLLIRHLGDWEIIAVREFLIQLGFSCPNRFTEIRKKYG